MIPILPCCSIDETLDFYVALGFEITYRQERPNTYGCVARGGINLHFFTMKGYDDPAQSYSTCVVLTPDVEELRRAFIAGAKAFYGKAPVTGIPRIGRMLVKPDGEPGFNMVDPGGNWIRFSQYDGTRKQEKAEQPTTTIGKAIQAATILAFSHGDLLEAEKVIDRALMKAKDKTSADFVRGLIARASISAAMGDTNGVRWALGEARKISLEADEQAALAKDFELMRELEEGLNEDESS
jgi:catechol 2,3-dioxygenase-like lactoylglutathione lyase family enzyme